ncbi:MAG TPA: RNA polymerase sigma factor [Terriglobales bacterium]|jgi:RNA polymerase sigma-70 factor (ECF subfamily)|nr:RNA polymerase sigma factor [Terriglobales bacterium]
MLESVGLPEMSESEAIEKAKNGDVRGYEALYHLHKRQIYSLCLRHTRNVPDAEDLTQEIFLQVYRKISSFRGDAKFGSWLYRVAFNFVLIHVRRPRLNQVSLTAFPEARRYPLRSNFRIQGCSSSLPIERVALRRAISSLSSHIRNVVILHDVRGYTHSEVARCLGVAVGTSKSQLSKAHLALRGILGGRTQPAKQHAG